MPIEYENKNLERGICKSKGHSPFFVNGRFSHGSFDRDTGKFGFRLIGSDVMADIQSFRVHAIEPDDSIWTPWE